MRDLPTRPLEREDVLVRCRLLTSRLVAAYLAPMFDEILVRDLNLELETLLQSIGLGCDRRRTWERKPEHRELMRKRTKERYLRARAEGRPWAGAVRRQRRFKRGC